MLNFKNNFLWKMTGFSKFQDPIEKFDKEFRKKSNQPAKSKKTDERKPKIAQMNKITNI